MHYWAGLLSLVAIWVVGATASGNRAYPWDAIRGADGVPSTSKFQFLVFSAVAMFSYVAIYVKRWESGLDLSLDEIPQNVMIAMGMSGVTLSAAKGITSSQVSGGRSAKAAVAPGGKVLGGIFLNDDGSPDLAKSQMVAWTIIAAGAYLLNTVRAINTGITTSLPDIDAPLMVLMGLSQGAYLGKKLVTADQPRISYATIDKGVVTLSGGGFGPHQAGSVVTIDGEFVPVSFAADGWSDAKLTFPLEEQRRKAGSSMKLAVLVGGRTSNTVTLTVP